MTQPEERDCLLYRKLSLILRSGTACKKEQAVPGDLAKANHPLPASPYSPIARAMREKTLHLSPSAPHPEVRALASFEGGPGEYPTASAEALAKAEGGGGVSASQISRKREASPIFPSEKGKRPQYFLPQVHRPLGMPRRVRFKFKPSTFRRDVSPEFEPDPNRLQSRLLSLPVTSP